MRSTEKEKDFAYWKRPWGKWAVLILALLQLLVLVGNLDEYRMLAEAGIFSPPEWENYAISKSFLCAGHGLTAALALGFFLIGALARSHRAARLAEGTFLIVLALLWCLMGNLLHLYSLSGIKILWILYLLVLLGGGIYSLWRSRSKREP